jgi:hypothetical protein
LILLKWQKCEDWRTAEAHGMRYRQMKYKQMQWQIQWGEKAIISNVSTSAKWHSTIIFWRDIKGWSDGGRLIGKCFLRAMRAEQGLKEAMGVSCRERQGGNPGWREWMA